MVRIFLFMVGISLSCSAFGQTNGFCETVLTRYEGRSDYFIPINIRAKSFSGKVIVENYNLFDFLKATRGFNLKTYRSYMLDILENNKEIDMKNVAIDAKGFFLFGKNVKENTFRIVGSSKIFDMVFAKGCNELVRYYFSPSIVEPNEKGQSGCKENIKRNGQNLFIRPSSDFAEQNNAVVRLFESDIPVSRDDISGSFTIAYSTLR